LLSSSVAPAVAWHAGGAIPPTPPMLLLLLAVAPPVPLALVAVDCAVPSEPHASGKHSAAQTPITKLIVLLISSLSSRSCGSERHLEQAFALMSA